MKWRAKRLTNYMRRGITDRWLGKGGFERFLKDMGERPGDDYDLDRIDNSRGYNKRNCHWILRSEHRKKSAIESKLRRLSEVLEELFDLTS
jgi:hypothetical protein